MSHTASYLQEVETLSRRLPEAQIENLVSELVSIRNNRSRLFLIGLGGSSANASHAANDFRKLCGIDAWCMTDNVAFLTAKANDEGWNNLFDFSFFYPTDTLFILSVGGGTDQVSTPIVQAVERARVHGRKILGIVGRDGGITKELGDEVVVIPTVNPERVTPHTEAFQMVLLHCIVSHPDLQMNKTKW